MSRQACAPKSSLRDARRGRATAQPAEPREIRHRRAPLPLAFGVATAAPIVYLDGLHGKARFMAIAITQPLGMVPAAGNAPEVSISSIKAAIVAAVWRVVISIWSGGQKRGTPVSCAANIFAQANPLYSYRSVNSPRTRRASSSPLYRSRISCAGRSDFAWGANRAGSCAWETPELPIRALTRHPTTDRFIISAPVYTPDS